MKLSFVPDEVRPGAAVDMHLQAAPLSLCSIGMVDKSVHVLGGNNQINKAKVVTQQQVVKHVPKTVALNRFQ